MGCVLSYGIDLSVRLDLPESALIAECGRRGIGHLDDPGDATVKALAHPVDYPPLDHYTMPGDRVAITLGGGVPHGGQIAAAVIRYLVAGGIDPESITLLRTAASADAGFGDPSRWLAEDIRQGLALLTHDPTDRNQLAYLAVSSRGEGILLNREITDADVVLPIGCFHGRYVAGHFGMYGAIFPDFADQKNQKRFRSPKTLGARGYHKKSVVGAVDEVGWLLGTTFTIQVIPGPAGSVLHVLAGEVGAVKKQAARLYRSAWHWSVPRRASLVVAAIEGNSHEQTWENLGRSLVTAAELVEDDGAIAVCSELAESPGPAIDLLHRTRSRDDALRQIGKDRPRDSLAAAQLAAIQDRVSIYLLSRLDPADVDELEIAPIVDSDEVVRLAKRHPSCLVLANAPRTTVSVGSGEW
jgi:nickel-dependent lactate racemase